MKKKALIVVGIILVIYFLFVTTDCMRLMFVKSETMPFITISSSEYENGNKYTGLGYSIKYYIFKLEITYGDTIETMERVYGAEFRLFDKILIWAWIE